MIQGTTKLLGVIGHPVEHSLSPVMHNAAIRHLGVDYVYLPFPIRPEDLATAVHGFAAIGLVGFNITIPHKQAIFPLLTTISETAQAIGAVNTVWHTPTGWSGTNTDVDGFLAPLKELNINWPGKQAMILGNGGAARAVVAGCALLGMNPITVVGRSHEKLLAFQTSWQTSPLTVSIQISTWAELPKLLSQADLVVNTTPVGMHPQVDHSPIDPSLFSNLKPGVVAYDLIYTPRPTKFLQLAQAQGATILDGLEMLVQQGAKALEIWLNQPIPVDIMRQSLLEHSDHRG
ncbi:MAG: shikimate dehydrogenase [Microcoleaceae cyanobacterium]